jgi:hypothetical protein
MSPPLVRTAATAQWHRRLPWAWLVLAVVISAPDAGAQSQPRLRAAAEAEHKVLFDRGVKLLDAKRYAEARAVFMESQRLSPDPVTLANVGRCQEGEQLLATAHRTYEEALRLVLLEPNAPKRDAFARVMQQYLQELEPAVPTLRFVPSPTPGAVVRLDGQPQPLGEALRVDPGVHRLEVSAAGHETRSDSVHLEKAQRLEYALPALSPSPTQGSRFGLAPPVLVGAGVLLGGVATYYGLTAMARGRRLEDSCTVGMLSTSCDDWEREWKSRANTASWLWVGAGLLAGTGITLFVLDSRSSSSSQAQALSRLEAWVGPDAAGLSASGRF